MGEITYQGDAPYSLPTAQPTTAKASGDVVEMIVYASVHGNPPTAFPILIRMPADAAHQLARELVAAGRAATLKEGR